MPNKISRGESWVQLSGISLWPRIKLWRSRVLGCIPVCGGSRGEGVWSRHHPGVGRVQRHRGAPAHSRWLHRHSPMWGRQSCLSSVPCFCSTWHLTIVPVSLFMPYFCSPIVYSLSLSFTPLSMFPCVYIVSAPLLFSVIDYPIFASLSSPLLSYSLTLSLLSYSYFSSLPPSPLNIIHCCFISFPPSPSSSLFSP